MCETLGTSRWRSTGTNANAPRMLPKETTREKFLAHLPKCGIVHRLLKHFRFAYRL